jgi:hypothetical protein
MKNKKLFFLLSFFLVMVSVKAQDLLETIDKEFPNEPLNAQATFKTTRISFAHSVETRKKGIVEFHFMNKFWNTPEPRTQSFAADRMSTRIGIEYGVTDKFTLGLGGTTWDGIFDSFLKYRLVQQQINDGGSPVSITFFQNMSYRSEATDKINAFDSFGNRLSFTSQLLMARKFTHNFSLQISPSLIYRNSLLSEENPQTQFAVGLGGRYKVGNHVSIVSEYYLVANPLETITTFNAFALGVNWEVGDIILQFQLTNARAMVEDAFITQTRTNFNFNDGNLHFGFNATYILHLKRNR